MHAEIYVPYTAWSMCYACRNICALYGMELLLCVANAMTKRIHKSVWRNQWHFSLIL